NLVTLPEKSLIPPAIKRGLHGGGFGPHPRNEQKGLSNVVGDLFPSNTGTPQRAELQNREEPERVEATAVAMKKPQGAATAPTPWTRLEQALKATDLLLH